MRHPAVEVQAATDVSDLERRRDAALFQLLERNSLTATNMTQLGQELVAGECRSREHSWFALGVAEKRALH